MKELSIEQKAKRYDEALETARKINSGDGVPAPPDWTTCEVIFPELKEDEDEIVRKWIKKELESKYVVDNIVNNVMADKALAWLERKGEQKPADKVEPKFKVGDWVVRNDETLQISGIDIVLDRTFHYWFTKGTWLSSKKMETAMLWTIQDAKDGDVLKEDSCIFIIKKMNSDGTAIAHCCLFDDGELNLTSSTLGFDVDSTHPATKEQCDLLFQKMKEAGYEWDAVKKELKKIEQMSAWSEEDETKIKSIIALLKSSALCAMDCNKGIIDESIKYLKSIKDRVLTQPKQEWSEVDELMLNDILTCNERHCHLDAGNILWLKSIKDRVRVQLQPELDDKQLKLLNELMSFLLTDCPKQWAKYGELLKSIKPQNTWKPSGRELGAILAAIGDEKQKGSDVAKELLNIYQQLKKLKN